MKIINWLKAQAAKVPAKWRGAIYGLLFVSALAALVFPDQFQVVVDHVQQLLDQIDASADTVGKIITAVAGVLALLRLTPDGGNGPDGSEPDGEEIDAATFDESAAVADPDNPPAGDGTYNPDDIGDPSEAVHDRNTVNIVLKADTSHVLASLTEVTDKLDEVVRKSGRLYP